MDARPLGDTALCLTLGPGDPSAAALADALCLDPPAGLIDASAAFDTVAIVYDPAAQNDPDPAARIAAHARQVLATLERRRRVTASLIDLAVAYGGPDGPDLGTLSDSLGLPVGDLIRRHAAVTYTVAAVGFLPGFAYLAGLPPELHAPRRSTPRTRVPAGSVAIGGPYTGVYPVDSPGGWHLIGRTTRQLFDPGDPESTPWRVGDRVRFVPSFDGGR